MVSMHPSIERIVKIFAVERSFVVFIGVLVLEHANLLEVLFGSMPI